MSLIFVVITSETCPACIALSTPVPGSPLSMLDHIKEWIQPYVSKIEVIRLSPSFRGQEGQSSSFGEQLNSHHPDLSKITQAFPSFFLFQISDWNNKVSPIKYERFNGSRNQQEFEKWAKNSRLKTSSSSYSSSSSSSSLSSLKNKEVKEENEGKREKINLPEKLPTTGSIHKTIIRL